MEVKIKKRGVLKDFFWKGRVIPAYACGVASFHVYFPPEAGLVTRVRFLPQ